MTATPTSTYNSEDLIAAYRALGLKPGDTVSVKTGLRSVGRFAGPREHVLDMHLKAIDQVIDLDRGTVVVASSTTNLCDTEISCSPAEAPGMAGALTEHIRLTPGARPSYHAFESYSALAARSDEILNDLSRRSYGWDTPEARLIELGFQMRFPWPVVGGYLLDRSPRGDDCRGALPLGTRVPPSSDAAGWPSRT